MKGGKKGGDLTAKNFNIKQYSDPKLHIPYKLKNGKKVPSIDKGAKWYVYFSFRNPVTNKMGRPFKVYQGLNRLKTVSERKTTGAAMVQIVREALQDGYNPYVEGSNKKAQGITVEASFRNALENLKINVKLTSFNLYRSSMDRFLRYAKDKGLADISIHDLTEKNIVDYLNHLGKPKNGVPVRPTTIHNNKAQLSTLMGQMKRDKVIKTNFIAGIETRKSKPFKNEIFTAKELRTIVDVCKKKHPELHSFQKFVFYAFMRNAEILNLQVGHCDMAKRVISIETKGEAMSHIYMIPHIYDMLKDWGIENLPSHYHIITPKNKPGVWDRTVKTKKSVMSNNFKAIREKLGISENKTIYSLRHNGASSLLEGYLKQGVTQHEAELKIMQIMRHKDLDTTRKYLRNIGAVLPKDWSGAYDVLL